MGNEAGWTASAKSGDVDAFNRLVIAYQQAAYGLAYRMLGHEDAAADATQEAFISAFTRLHQFRGGSFKAWLLRITLNQVYDQLRHAQRHPAESLDSQEDEDDSPALQVADSGPTPEEHALSAELMACLEAGLVTLPPDQRAAVILSDVQGMSYEEIAATTGANVGTVKSRLSRGRHGVRLYLAQHKELLPPSIRHYYETGAA